jgi:hypothetical protein
MISDTDLPHQSDTFQQPSRSFKLIKLLVLLGTVSLITIVAGVSWYLLGMKNGQSTPTLQLSPSPNPTLSFPLLPTIEDQSQSPATTHWKTYINAQWGLFFKYPETWFPQEVLGWNPPGDSINFYPYGVTPYPGEADNPTNAVFAVENQEGHKPQTNEQFISEASQTDGKRMLNVAGKPAIRGDGYNGESHYIIKLSSTRLLVLVVYSENAAERLDDIVSTIKFTNE